MVLKLWTDLSGSTEFVGKYCCQSGMWSVHACTTICVYNARWRGKEREAKAFTDPFNMVFISVWEIDARSFKLCGGDWRINEWYRVSPLSRPRETPWAEADCHHRQVLWPAMHNFISYVRTAWRAQMFPILHLGGRLVGWNLWMTKHMQQMEGLAVVDLTWSLHHALYRATLGWPRNIR